MRFQGQDQTGIPDVTKMGFRQKGIPKTSTNMTFLGRCLFIKIVNQNITTVWLLLGFPEPAP